ncbi:uncharacterized protein LOC107426603 isoform X1 [Ziziphus jujuba]|uniref:Uncharacterized protein LOC107426603 isoform X1 n=3 Tax=Ziziphus jujuba TaxID=326968 RepID=A0ABM3IWQ8_ZIZJJ|nr:uncharacterized protein LOC107426603 isoform X1 [Ziziphus jujuba]
MHVAMAVEDEVMEGIVSSLESNQKGETLSVEDVVWADSCLVKESEIPDSDWNSIKDALLDILTSEAGLLNSSASVSDDPNVENDIEMPTSTEVEKAELFLRSGAETEASSVRTPIDLLPINEESGTNSENIAIKKYLNDFQSLAFVGNPFLPTYSDGMKESETTELGTDSSSSLYDTEPTTDDIFRVWDLDVPAEEDELAKQLKKALEESSHLSKSSTLDESVTWKDHREESIDDVITGIADLSLKQSSS